MLILFWFCVAVIAYVYFGYPFGLWLAPAKRTKPFHAPSTPPLVSIIVAAHNEESCIEEKLRNLLDLDYPRDKVEILIGSDGSTDRTGEIVRRYEDEGAALVSFPQQRGKSAMQNGLVAAASGEILAFTDADCLFPASALARLMEHFADSRVGLVSACPRFRNVSDSAVTENEGIYLRYETWLRRRESDLGILAMASGSLFAMRRSLWKPLATEWGDDFALPLRVLRAGFVNRLAPGVIASTDLSESNPAAMLRMKTRIITKDCRTLLAHRELLDPFRYGLAAGSLWSHKLLRWLVPYFLMAAFASNALLLGHSFFRILFVLQTAFYLFAAAGIGATRRENRLPWSVPASFCLVNLAALIGTLKAFAGCSSGAWKPERKRARAATSPARTGK